MDGPVWLSIGSIVVSSAVAITAVYLAARFAAKQAHLGRVWDRKAEAYSAILEALHDTEEWYSQNLDDEFEDREVDEAIKKARNADYSAARKLLRRSIAREVWLLPPDVQERIRDMNKVLAARYESWFEDIDAGFAEVRKAAADVAGLARADLKSPAAVEAPPH